MNQRREFTQHQQSLLCKVNTPYVGGPRIVTGELWKMNQSYSVLGQTLCEPNHCESPQHLHRQSPVIRPLEPTPIGRQT